MNAINIVVRGGAFLPIVIQVIPIDLILFRLPSQSKFVCTKDAPDLLFFSIISIYNALFKKMSFREPLYSSELSFFVFLMVIHTF